jgi:hypothetical protein
MVFVDSGSIALAWQGVPPHLTGSFDGLVDGS